MLHSSHMHLLVFFGFLCCAFPWRTFAANAFVYQYKNQNAHIAYKGDVSITWNTFTKNGDPCTIQMGPQNHSWFYVGVHPNWDPNPLFFELKHLSSVKCNSRGENCVDFDSATSGGFFVYTNDEIYNLEFASSVIDLNFDRGDSGEYELQRTVDFGKSEIGKVKFEGSDGYRVQLGKDSWLNNNTYEPSVTLDYKGNKGRLRDFENGCFLDPKYSLDFMKQEWTGIHDDFGVDFTFTNNKAKASFYLKANRTEMTLTFTGNRNVSEITNELWNYPEIDLDTSDPETPGFKWRGGGAVAFGNDSPSRPQPTVGSLDSTSSTASSTSIPTSAMQSSTSSASISTVPSTSQSSESVSSSDSTTTTGPTNLQSGPGPETSVPSLAIRHHLDLGLLWGLLGLTLGALSMVAEL
ncbi:hypothetical protein TWF102_000105 [Orbilia oligospora]|uniref:Uncharacterized protein n=1 Tax=Orbilia oligospora TaxID=2813651 RepID=A0A7C8JGU6_ORBOL|nr:hypothetical protein TWF102_000105 [Orbilia oligospora]KAF3115199.1 hypothetical protein TWF103_011460 [Orbilia oligospora]